MHFPRWNRTADELCVTEIAQVVWAVQMSTVEFHPWNSRRADTEKPDEWRIDLDPGADCALRRRCGGSRTSPTRCSTSSARPASRRPSGGTGMHVYVRIPPDHGFKDVRRAALAFAREVERRAPDDVTTTWWRKDRDPAHLFVDYNQNARDHTIAAAYSVRGNPDGTVSDPDPLGRGRRRRAATTSRSRRCRRATPRSATCTPASTTRSSTSRRCWSGPSATSATGEETPPEPDAE